MNAMEFINSYSKSGGKVFDLSRIKGLLTALENPEEKLKFVHIAGTNGKGSTLELSSRAFINSGYRVGQFTSPYIHCYEDRIRINGENIPYEKVEEYAEIVNKVVENVPYSQFEITFCIALLYFSEKQCDIVFVETGIGGLLDATNAIKSPLLSIITSVSFDHVDILGHTLKEIATHKAGIIKENSPCILAPDNDQEVIDVVKGIAKKKNASFYVPDMNLCTDEKYTLLGTKFTYMEHEFILRMHGKHMIYNAVTAFDSIKLLCEKYGYNITDDSIDKAFSSVQVGGRIEIAMENPLVIIDGGHNESGATALVKSLKGMQITPTVMVVGVTKSKDYHTMVEIFSSICRKVICVDGFINSSLEKETLAKEFCANGCDAEVMASTAEDAITSAIKKARQENGVALICGSLYLATEAKNSIANL